METGINIDSLRQGNHKAYEMLFGQWYAPLCHYAYSILHNEDEAKDMVQVTFCKLWDQHAELEIHTSIKSYLYRMVHNNCLNKIKQSKVRAEHDQYIVYKSDETVSDTENGVLQNELQRRIEVAIESLPPRCQEVFRMSRQEQLSYAEIAEKLNISTNTVETQVVKALRVMREQLKDYLPLALLLILLDSK